MKQWQYPKTIFAISGKVFKTLKEPQVKYRNGNVIKNPTPLTLNNTSV